MCRQPLDLYEPRPKSQVAYLNENGWHFNNAALAFAVSLMRRKNPATGKLERLPMMKEEEVNELMKKYGITLENNIGKDHVYVANKAKYCYFKSSIPDEKSLALYIKNEVDSIMSSDGTIMREWVAKLKGNGIPVPWRQLVEDE